MALVEGGEVIARSAGQGSKVAVILDRTCFYAEGGGQASDIGRLVSKVHCVDDDDDDDDDDDKHDDGRQ
jgi:alanyl-tRNA synthetase